MSCYHSGSRFQCFMMLAPATAFWHFGYISQHTLPIFLFFGGGVGRGGGGHLQLRVLTLRNATTYLAELLLRINDIMTVKHLE